MMHLSRPWLEVLTILLLIIPLTLLLSLGVGIATWGGILMSMTPISNLSKMYPDAAPVAAWYGPGVWLCFVGTYFLGLWKTGRSLRTRAADSGKDEAWNMDVLLVIAYVGWTSGDLVLQCTKLLGSPTYTIASEAVPALLASATVVHTTFGLCILPTILAMGAQARKAASGSARRTALWCSALVLDFASMVIFERTLLRHHVPDLVASDGYLTAIFGKYGPFLIRLHYIPEYISTSLSFGFTWRNYGNLIAMMLLLSLLIACYIVFIAQQPSEAFSPFIIIPLLLFVGVSTTVILFVVWLWVALIGILVPCNSFFPQSDISITAPSQLGPLATFTIAQVLRPSSKVRRLLAPRKWRQAQAKKEPGEEPRESSENSITMAPLSPV